MNIEALLAETREVPPCGPDLEHDAAFLEFEIASRGKAEQQFGATVVAAEEPPWPDLLTRGAALLARSKDLRVASVLVRALVHTEGYAGLLPGLQLVHGLLNRYWSCLHPTLDADDDNDPTMRLNALAPLAHPLVLVRDLRAAPLVRSRQHGQLLVRDLEISLGKLPPARAAGTASAALSPAQIDAILGGVAAEDPAAIARAAETLAAAKALVALLDDKVGSQSTPDFKPLLAVLHTVAQACGKFQPVAMAVEAVETTPSDGGAATPAAAPARPADGEIRSREDALKAIDKVVQYLERNEPTNPAPLLLKRGKRFMTMSFVDIVKEIAPDSIAKIDAIAGPAQKEP